VFLKNSEPAPPVDVDAAIDVKPWEASVEDGSSEGMLCSVVVVRSHRTQCARAYDAGDMVFDRGEVVALEPDACGPSTGVVVRGNRRELHRIRLPRVVRRAHPNEVNVEPKGRRRENEVFAITRHAANALDLPIKLVRAQAEQSGKIIVFIACEDRIDFRELYRRVTTASQARVEFRQIGVRDAAKMVGGVAPCGLKLCCSSFLKDFTPVSIKMAKEQGLVLNPQRVSGVCGRLLCCLTYEDAIYRLRRKSLPKLGKRVMTASGPGRVRDVDVLSEVVRVLLDNGEVITAGPSEISPLAPDASGEDRGDKAGTAPARPGSTSTSERGGRE